MDNFYICDLIHILITKEICYLKLRFMKSKKIKSKIIIKKYKGKNKEQQIIIKKLIELLME